MAIRVLHIIGSLKLGGAQIVVKHIVENASEDVEHFVYPLRCKKIDIPIEGTILSNPYCNYDPRKFFDILKVCKKYNIDLIHAHLHKPILGALLATYFQKIPVIVHEHGPIGRRGVQYSGYRLILRLLKKRAKLFIAVSNAIATQLNRHSGVDPARIRVVHNAVDLDRFQPEPALRESIRKTFSYSENDIVIGFVGRLHRVKGVDLLINAIPLLIQENTNFKLLLVGAGPLRKSLEKKVRSNGTSSHVHFAGFRSKPAEIMNAFDLACIPSRQEPFGIVALEMMSMNIPIVCSGVPGLSDIVENKHNALVSTENIPKHIAECIKQLAYNAELRKTLVENARHDAQKFGTSRLTQQIDEIYRKITNKGID